MSDAHLPRRSSRPHVRPNNYPSSEWETGSPLLGAPFAERAPNVLRRDCHVSDVHDPSHAFSLPPTPFSQQVSSTPYNPLALHTSATSINPMEWSPTNPFLSPEILSGEPTSISSSLFGFESRSIDAIARPPLVAMATHEYSAAAAPAEYDRAPVAHRFEDRFDSATRFDSSQTPPPFNFQPVFPGGAPQRRFGSSLSTRSRNSATSIGIACS